MSKLRPYLEKIHRLHFQLSAEQPIIGSCNLYSERSALTWDMHYGLEFGLVCSGKGRRFFFDKSERNVEAGDIWFCGMWEPHGGKVVTAPYEIIVLKIWPPFLTQMHFLEAPDFCPLAPFNAPPKQRPRTSNTIRKLMIDFGGQLKKIISANMPHQTIKLRFILQEILLNIFEFWPGATDWNRRPPSEEFSQINQTLQMVFSSHTFVSTSDAAHACGMERHKFSALFRSWMSVTFAGFSVRHRLHQAAMQLRSTPEPLKTIARYWGFVDVSHFHRLFQKHFGLSPIAYRNQLHGN